MSEEFKSSTEYSGEKCYPLHINEDLFVKKGDRLKRLELQWDLFQQPLDADTIISLFGEYGEKFYQITDVNGSGGQRGVLINERFFQHPLCIGDFVNILWADGIKLPLTNWAIQMYYYE